MKTSEHTISSRRDFLLKSSLFIAGTSLVSPYAFSKQPARQIRLALVGCGGRGSGAAAQALMASPDVKLVAMADVFKDKLDTAYHHLTQNTKIKGQVEVPEANKFSGFDGYQKAIALADAVILASPASFRPEHFEFATKEGKHSFLEKPLACDGPGIRKVLATGQAAEKKGLSVVVGLQYRYEPALQELVKRIQDGAIGDLLSANSYYMTNHVNMVPRQPGQSELEYQMRNWRYFNWLWTGSPAGLQIHHDDIANWVMKDYPVKTHGIGGRAALKGPEHGDIFDHFYNEYEYANGFKLHSEIRHISGTVGKRGITFIGTKGKADFFDGIKTHKGELIWKKDPKVVHNPYQIEQDVFIKSIQNNQPVNDTEWGAKSTLATIMGRMAAHSGLEITWDDAMKSDIILAPENLTWDSPAPSQPDATGNYQVPMPGIAKV